MIDLGDFVTLDRNTLVTDSRRVAKHFGKLHKNVLRDIERLGCSPEFAKLNFELCFEINRLANGKRIPFYRITKDGFAMLAMGYTGAKAMRLKEAYINAFNRMAEQLQTISLDLWEQRLRLERREATSQAWASFGSRCMLERKAMKPRLENERQLLDERMQPVLPFGAKAVLQ